MKRLITWTLLFIFCGLFLGCRCYEIMYSRPQGREPDMGWETWTYRLWWGDAVLSVFQGEDPALVLAEAQRRAERFYDCYAPLAELASPNFPTYTQVRECAQQADPDFRWPG
jgi:hypothetical protein